jgi:zinc transport system permease protein
VAAYHRQFLAVVFDEELARLRGIPVTFFYLLLLVLVAVTVVLLIQVAGLILVLAPLTLPAAIAGHSIRSLGGMMLIATLIGSLVSSAGLALSYGPDLPPGPTIILPAGAI